MVVKESGKYVGEEVLLSLFAETKLLFQYVVPPHHEICKKESRRAVIAGRWGYHRRGLVDEGANYQTLLMVHGLTL